MAGEGEAMMSACVSPAEPGAIERHGSWIVLGADPTGKRIVCRCAICSYTCQIGAEALEVGGVVCAGCIIPRNNPAPLTRAARRHLGAQT
jgi:hypothetical protein